MASRLSLTAAAVACLLSRILGLLTLFALPVSGADPYAIEIKKFLRCDADGSSWQCRDCLHYFRALFLAGIRNELIFRHLSESG